MKRIFLILGAIGSGKSVISDFLMSFDCFNGIEYVGTDIYKKKFFNHDMSEDKPEKKLSEKKRGYRCADELMFNRIEQLCISGTDFMLELCPTNKNKVDTIIDIIKKYEYEITTFYIGVNDVTKNLERCDQRVQMGYDPVDQRKVKKRFIDAQKGLLNFCYISKILYFVDNSNDTPKVVAKYWDNKYCIYESNCAWFKSIESFINKNK